MRAAVPFALVLGVTSTFAASARAQPSPTDKATADALFRAGKELLDAGKPAEACPKLAESQRIDPRTGTLLNLATCHEQEGKTASAWAEFNEAAAQASNAKQVDREKFARAKADELERALSKIKIVVVAPAPGLEVKVDGKVLRSAVIGTAIPLDPGAHIIEAAAPSKSTWSKSIALARGPLEQTVEVPALEDAAPAPAAPEPARPPSPEPPSRLWTSLGLAGFGVGSAALGAGVFFGARTFAKRDDAEARCVGNRCPQEALDTYDEARSASTLSTVFVVVGLAMMAAGAYLVLFPPRSPSASSVALGPGMAVGRW